MAKPPKDMRVIPEPDETTHTILKCPKEDAADFGVFIVGEGSLRFRCGACRKTLVRNVSVAQVTGIVFCCPQCEAYNEIPKASNTN